MTRNPWPYAMAGAIAGIIGLQVAVVSIALSNRPVLESGDANGYHSSTAWDAERAAFAKARALHWGASIDSDQAAVEYRLSVTGAPVTGLVGEVVVARADGRATDRKVPAQEVAPGVYRVDRAGLPAGRYRLRAELTRAADRWLDERWVMLP